MIIFGGPGDGPGPRAPRGLLGPEDAATLEASRYNTDISFAFGVQPRLQEAEQGLLADLGENAAPDGGGFTDGFVTEFDKAYQGILGEAPSARAREITSEPTANMRMRAQDKALVFEAERRGSFFRQNLEDSIATARAGVQRDPEGAEETFSGLLGTLSFAANGWLGRDKGEELAQGLKKELFEGAALTLIDRDPNGAREQLGQGLFGDNLAPEDRARFTQAADRRMASLAEDARAQEKRDTRAARLDGIATRTRDLAAFTQAVEAGEMTRTVLDTLLDQGRIDGPGHESLNQAIEQREQDDQTRLAAIERVAAFLDPGIVAREPDEEDPLGPFGPFGFPDPQDIDVWWEHVFAPSLASLDPEFRARAEDHAIKARCWSWNHQTAPVASRVIGQDQAAGERAAKTSTLATPPASSRA